MGRGEEVKNPSAIFLNRGRRSWPAPVWLMVVWEESGHARLEFRRWWDTDFRVVSPASWPWAVKTGVPMLLAVLHVMQVA